MEISYDELSNVILKIATAQDIVKIEHGSKTMWLAFKQPNNLIKLRANSIYDDAYNKALEDGLLTSKQLEELLETRNIFTSKDQEMIDKLESKLNGQKVLLAKTTKVKANSDRLKNIIAVLEHEINEIMYKKYSRMMMSAETKADEYKRGYICSMCVYDESDNLQWGLFDSFMNETDLVLKDKITSEFSKFYNGVDTTTVRYVARHGLWRIQYVNSQKVSDPLFGVPTSQYSNDQLNLVYWSNYYQNIYEMMPEDKPSDLIIEDDDALDAYMSSFYEERTREDAARRSKKDSGGKLSAFDKEEVIVTQSNELYQDIKYDKPREAQRLKDRTDVKKKARRRTR